MEKVNKLIEYFKITDSLSQSYYVIIDEYINIIAPKSEEKEKNIDNN